MNDPKDDFYHWDLELSHREVFLIGKVITLWGALEHEVFMQTLLTFESPDQDRVSLPKDMNNLQFTGILNLWKVRVVDTAEAERATVLRQLFDAILSLKEGRDTIVHGMWKWSADELARISTVRVRKKEVITVHFTADDLESLGARLASINFKLRYPGGADERVRQMAEQGGHISRRGLSLFTGHPVAGDWLSSMPAPEGEEKE